MTHGNHAATIQQPVHDKDRIDEENFVFLEGHNNKEVLIRTTSWCGLEIVRTTMWCGLEIIRTTVTYLITAFSALLNCWNNSVIDALWDQFIEL